uniref:Uncharacterized protein n=1 Tax=Anguilla anguilla TaxID=7936 RepID=A0A0E9S0P4_ANGAN
MNLKCANCELPETSACERCTPPIHFPLTFSCVTARLCGTPVKVSECLVFIARHWRAQ